jgi:hypothetical protein
VTRSGLPAVLLAAGAIFACRRPAEAPAPAAAETAITAAPTAPVPAATRDDFQRLVGRWMRSDWDYMIWIKSAAPDGTLEAAYLNPNPIHVSRAEARREEGKLTLLVQMSDRNYPGSYYTLAYDPGSDTLYGVYHQLVQNQQFEVAFRRIEEDAGKPPGQ